MVEPIQLTPSETNGDALVNAIRRATKQNIPIQLQPGTYLTKPGKSNLITIGGNGLTIGPVARPRAAPRSVIKRPNHSIDLLHPDDNHGLFFVPSPPTPLEKAEVTWKHYHRGDQEFEFAIIVRGTIRLFGIDIDCNMGAQGLETLPRGLSAEHSCMLGFAGRKYAVENNPTTTMKRFIFVGFEAVELTDLRVANGGYADEIWFSRGYFNPNIARVRVDRLIAGRRINRKRATVDFSGLCQDITVTNSTFFRLGCEATDVPFREMPRSTAEFHPSVWNLSNLHLDGIDLGAHGRSYVIQGNRLETTEQCNIHEAGGSITDSDLTVTDRQRLIALHDFEFRDVRWTLKTSEGKNLGLKITARPSEPCKVSFLDNTFEVQGAATDQVVIDSEYSREEEANEVRVVAIGCSYPATYGHAGEPPIAHVYERGRWTFARADLEGRDPDVALPMKIKHQDVFRDIV
jgi:hypothetical protein